MKLVFRLFQSISSRDSCVTKKQCRKRPKRFRKVDRNMEKNVPLESSKEALDDSQISASVSNSPESEIESDGGASFKANERSKENPTVFSKQMSRIEAKMNHIQTALQQIQRMIIRNKIECGSSKSDVALSASELPLQTVESLDKFEIDLSTPSYRKEIVSFQRFVHLNIVVHINNSKFNGFFQFEYLAIINGAAGDGDGSKIIRSVVFATIAREVLSRFTWTGKSAKPNSKLGFFSKKKTVQLFFDVVRLYDSQYTKSECEDDLKYKVFKHAYKE